MADWRHSITLRLSLAFALLATVVFAALGVYFSRAADDHMAELDAVDLFGKLALIGHVGSQEKSAEAFAARLGDALIGQHGVIVSVDGPQGTVFKWPSAQLAEPLAAVGISLGSKARRLALGAAEYRALAADMETAWGGAMHVVVARDIHHHTAFLDQLRHDFWLAVLAAALLTAVVGALVVRRGMRPVRDIARAAGRMSAGQLAERIPEQGVPQELAELVNAFNAMLGRLEESFRRLSDFSADLAHELRTPIHSLRMQTEVSLSKARHVDEYRDLLASNLEAYERLARIIADMLFLAKADHGLLVPQNEALGLLPLCERLIEYYGLLAENVRLQLVGDDLTVSGDRLMLERAIGNVLVNAIHHTPSGGAISVRIEAIDGQAEIAIANTGKSIPDDAQHRVFDRFVRLDAGSEGTGLGLAIARSIVMAHRGEIALRVSENMTEFYMRLPRHAAHPTI
ncbi:heavy metal sensor histidine kinase [Dechloromonas sp. HYN0024]|uniref:heavy metal sensor histidine kinase n=1 Tax=Dechloromonas sp. HYN0024 TaxID=2231055 RepID=UPI000E44A069|nr:heavy metal sensor histidine kinase [Dechloromonas sp. HYN0024]AXS80320.1 HAMP domain-containing protein [Dechloromonas sp. HYN0024]